MKTVEQIHNMLDTQKLYLNFWQKLDYFRSIYVTWIVGAMMLIPIILLNLQLNFYFLMALPLIVGLFLYKKLKKGLKFKVLKTGLSKAENYLKICQTFEALNVEIEYQGMNWLVGRINKLLPYKGEQIYVLNTDGCIYINSISAKGGLKFATNKRNVALFEQYFLLN